jgi:protein-S-isoprenylcysteine O-methyltransferase Ste14
MKMSRYQKYFGIGLVGLLISMVLFTLLALLDRALGHVPISRQPATVKVVGFILIALWVCWHSWCIRTIKNWWIHDRLCTNGPFRFVRHPMYSGGVLFVAIGVALICNSWIILLLPLFMYASYSILVRKEEAMMAAVFGEEYRRYAGRTGRFFPRILPAK